MCLDLTYVLYLLIGVHILPSLSSDLKSAVMLVYAHMLSSLSSDLKSVATLVYAHMLSSLSLELKSLWRSFMRLTCKN